MAFFLPMWAIWSLLAMSTVAEAAFTCHSQHDTCKSTGLKFYKEIWYSINSLGIKCPNGLVAKRVTADIYDDDGYYERDDKCTKDSEELRQTSDKRWESTKQFPACECGDFESRITRSSVELYVWITAYCGRDDSTQYWSCEYKAGRCIPTNVLIISADFDFSKEHCIGRPSPHALSTFKCGSESSHPNICADYNGMTVKFYHFKNFTVRCPGNLEAKQVQAEIRDYASLPGKPDDMCTKKPLELIQDERDKTWRTPKHEAVAVCECAKGKNERANYYVWITVHCGCHEGAVPSCKFSGGKCIPTNQFIISGDFDFSTQECN